MSKLSKTSSLQQNPGGAIKNFIAGGFGGACLVLAGHPFDTVKVRLQSTSKYSGAFDCCRKTMATEGLVGFYKGMGTPLVMVTPLFALGFFGYGIGKNIVAFFSSSSSSLSPTQLFTAGAISACFTTWVITPVERIKCLLQTQGTKYKGPLHCSQMLWREGGVASLYRGLGSTFMRGIPQAGLYYMTYDVLKQHLGHGEPLSTSKTLFAGGLTGIINWTFVLPLDVVKSRVQTASDGVYPRGVRDALPHLLKSEGLRGLYCGIVPVFIRAFPANAACFMGYESAIKLLNFVS